MPQDYGDGYDYPYGPTPSYHDYPNADQGPVQFYYMQPLLILIFYIVAPLVVILNLILFVKTVRTQKISGEPWRWLIAHTSFCIIITAILDWNRNLALLYHVPSLMASSACYFFSFVESVVWIMSVISSTLIVTERFHGLRLGVENGGSFSKKQVILCLVPFWIIMTLAITLPTIASALRFGDSVFFVSREGICYAKYNVVQLIQMIVWLWAFPTFIVVFIGALVLRGRKTTTDAMKQSIVNPTVALSVVGFLFLMVPIAASIAFFVLGFHWLDYMFQSISLLFYLFDVAFPIVWLVTWSRTGDISLKCCTGDENEQKRLLDQKN